MSWYTKEDVLDDLEQVMGGRVKDLDEQFILIGEQPPPPCRSGEEDDEELVLRLYGRVGDKVADKVGIGPDLAGITEMLRMVDKHECPDSDENDKHSLQENGTTIISISKLNPPVPSFIPNNSISTENKKDEKTKVTHVVDNDNEKLGISDSKEKVSENINPVLFKEISEKLKNKISSLSKTDCLKIKQERNLAIATLLKLYTEVPTTSCTDESTPPKLIKPEYFEKSICNKPLCNRTFKNTQTKSLLSKSSLSNKKNKNAILDSKMNTSINQEVEKSVAKVNKWLNQDEKSTPKESALFLGPVTFKRKEKVKSKTPTSDISDKNQNKAVSSHFVPTAYANKLSQSYMERRKAQENQAQGISPPITNQMTIWSKIEKHLKAKDEEITHRKLEESAQNFQQCYEENEI